MAQPALPDLHAIYHAQPPDLVESRQGRCLMVWGGLAQWMVVDEELAAFLRLFDGRRSLKTVIRESNRQEGRGNGSHEQTAVRMAGELLGRGILTVLPGPSVLRLEPVRLANLTINLTNRCNLRCAWCYNADHHTDEMPIRDLMQAISRGRRLFTADASLIILGGEPLIDPPRLLEALDFGADLFKSDILISTNGTLLTEAMVQALAERRVGVQVSLDSPFAGRNDALRGAGTFARVRDGVRRLVAAGVPTTLCMVFDRSSIAEFESYLNLALAWGVREARVIPMRMIGRGRNLTEQAPILDDAFEHLIAILARRPELRRLLLRDFYSIISTICRYSTSRTGCGIGRKVVFIDADGRVYPCPNHLLPEYCCGSLEVIELEAIVMQSPVMRRVRDLYRVDRLEGCSECAVRCWCAGDCRGEALSVTGNPSACSPHCREHQRLLVRMMWLIADNLLPLGDLPASTAGRRPVDSFAV